jgi:hypothetical protein
MHVEMRNAQNMNLKKNGEFITLMLSSDYSKENFIFIAITNSVHIDYETVEFFVNAFQVNSIVPLHHNFY